MADDRGAQAEPNAAEGAGASLQAAAGQPVNAAKRMPRQWLRDLPITAKLATIVVAFSIAIVVLLVVVGQAMDVAAGVRAYVAGEGLWSKGQKDGVYFLTRYVRSHDESDYENFRRAVAVPLGDRAARMEMEKPQFNAELAAGGFIDGGNAPGDVPAMIALFRHFHEIGFFGAAVRIWRNAEVYVLELVDCGDEIHRAVTSGTLSHERESQLLDRIDEINTHVSPLERDFSSTLADGARDVRNKLFASVVAAAAVMLAFGLLVSWLIARDLRNAIVRLRGGALSVSAGRMDHRIEVVSRDEIGELTSVFNEMIERRRDAEQALRSATEFSETVMQNATDAIYVFDLEGRFTLANQRTCEITGYPRGQLLGMPWAMLIPREDLPHLTEIFESVIREGRPMHKQETPLLRRDGKLLTVSFSAAPLLRDGATFAVVGTAEDITERKRAEAELAARAEELARSNRELEQFAYVASHDLQEPLRTVAGFAQLLSRRYRGQLDQEADEFIDAVTGGAQQMKSLIQDLLAYSRVSHQPQELKPAQLNEIFADACASLQAAIEASGASITRDDLPSLRVNRSQIRQLFQNLIGNAIKFHGEAPPRVHVSAQAGPKEWCFAVRDHGIGIDPRHANRIFVLFQRLHTREDYPGNGIGLTICKKIVELHGGRIWVEPAEPGCVFRFTLKPDQDTPRN